MKIAVTGASGYLGNNFIKAHRNLHEFIALTRDAAAAGRIEGTSYLECDYSVESLKDVLRGCDAVVHLAYAMATGDNERKGMEAYRSSMDMTERVFKTAMDLGIDNMVFASSRLVYSNYSEEPFRETDELSPATSYGKSKVMMEALCEDLNEKGAHIKVLRFGQIIGADMRVRGMFQIFLEKAGNDEALTLIGNDIRDYICVKDACRAIMTALEHPELSGIFNISMGHGVNNRMMAEAVIRELGSRSEIVVDPARRASGDKIVLNCTLAAEKMGFKCKYDTIEKIVADTVMND